jgi:hypothetical protein
MKALGLYFWVLIIFLFGFHIMAKKQAENAYKKEQDFNIQWERNNK